jgi:hypothetical protein
MQALFFLWQQIFLGAEVTEMVGDFAKESQVPAPNKGA